MNNQRREGYRKPSFFLSSEYYAWTMPYREEAVWRIRQYKNAYMPAPRSGWPDWMIRYRSFERFLADQMIEVIWSSDDLPRKALADMADRYDRASEEPKGETYALFRDIVKGILELL